MSALTCPMCGQAGQRDERRPAEVAGLTFVSVGCDQPAVSLSDHMFPVRWLETDPVDAGEVAKFQERFVYVRGPLEPGSAIAEAFGDVDPIQAWIEEVKVNEGVRLLIRL